LEQETHQNNEERGFSKMLFNISHKDDFKEAVWGGIFV